MRKKYLVKHAIMVITLPRSACNLNNSKVVTLSNTNDHAPRDL